MRRRLIWISTVCKRMSEITCCPKLPDFALTHILIHWMGFKVQTSFSSESSHVAYQMNRKVGHAHTMIICTMDGLGGLWEVFFNPAWDSCIA